MIRRSTVPALSLLALTLVAACGGGGTDRPSTAPATTTPAPAPQIQLTVLAAASLSKAFAAEGQAYTRAHPGTTVRFSFTGSQALVAQVQQGAPADVLATADTATMAKVSDQLAAPAKVFARNRLAILTAPGNPKHLRTLADLARPGVSVVLAGPTVPVGKAAAKALRTAGVTVHPVSLEDAVTGVVTKVRLGEADAGIGYVSDVTAAKGAVAGTPLAPITNSYPAGVLSRSAHRAEANAFVAFVLSPAGRALLASYGFLPPP